MIGYSLNEKVVKSKTNWLLFAFLFTLMVLPRWYYVENFAVALPFWDQWDAEWVGLLKPWTENKLVFSNLWINHNEHRIVPTRLMTLLCFELSGVWSNMVEARLNILLGVSTPLLLIWLLYRKGELSGFRWLVVAVIVADATMPFSWENMLIGFQSQFYFLNLFTLLSMALAVYRPQSIGIMLIVTGLCVLSVLTMASGLITPIAVAFVYSLNNYVQQRWSARTLVMFAILFLIGITGYITMPNIAAHHFLHAQNMTEMIKTTIRIMGWPLTDHKLYIGLLWLPTLITIPAMLVNRRFKRIDLLMFGCFIWTGAQVLALAYGRGHELYDVASRYTEILLLGLAGNAWFVIRATEEFTTHRKARISLHIVAFTFFSAIFYSHAQRLPRDLEAMKMDHELRLIQTNNVYLYLKTGDKRVLEKPRMHIPYPNVEGFRNILDHTGVRKLLLPDPSDPNNQ
jgi:hypothetical protein